MQPQSCKGTAQSPFTYLPVNTMPIALSTCDGRGTSLYHLMNHNKHWAYSRWLRSHYVCQASKSSALNNSLPAKSMNHDVHSQSCLHHLMSICAQIMCRWLTLNSTCSDQHAIDISSTHLAHDCTIQDHPSDLINLPVIPQQVNSQLNYQSFRHGRLHTSCNPPCTQYSFLHTRKQHNIDNLINPELPSKFHS